MDRKTEALLEHLDYVHGIDANTIEPGDEESIHLNDHAEHGEPWGETNVHEFAEVE